MSIRAIQAVWDHSQHKAAKRLLMLALADAARSEDFRAWPGHDALAVKCNVTDRYIRKMLAQISVTANEAGAMVERGEPLPELITVPGGDGPKDTTEYYINLPGAELGTLEISTAGVIIFSLERGNHSSHKRGNHSSARGNHSSARGNGGSARGNGGSDKGEREIPQTVRPVSDPLGTVSDPGRSPALFVGTKDDEGMDAPPPIAPAPPSASSPMSHPDEWQEVAHPHNCQCLACVLKPRSKRPPSQGWKDRR